MTDQNTHYTTTASDTQTKQTASDSNDIDIQSQLATCQADVQAWKEKFLRVTADFQNFTRRSEKERSDWAHHAQAGVLKELLPIIDDLERALQELGKQEQQPEIASVITGLTMIHQAFGKVLTKFGVKEITDTATFNPDLHEALMTVESSELASGAIVAVLQKGYMMHDTVLRHAKVSVAQ
jgi:molecular chaperone GrpE